MLFLLATKVSGIAGKHDDQPGEATGTPNSTAKAQRSFTLEYSM